MAGGSVTTLAQIVIKRVSALLIRFILFYFFSQNGIRISFKCYSRLRETQGCTGPRGPIPSISGAVIKFPNTPKEWGHLPP